MGALLRLTRLLPLLGAAGCLYPDNYLFVESGGSGGGGAGGVGGTGGTGGVGNQGGGGANGGTGGTGGGGAGGSTAGAGGATGGSGGSAGMAGSGGSLPSTETNCFDAVDDDGDGDVDCKDTDCVAFAKCMPNNPLNWSGPVVLYEGAAANDPNCPASWPTDAYELNAGPSGSGSCSPCTCGNPTGMSCTWPQNSPPAVLLSEPHTSSTACNAPNEGCVGEMNVPPNWTGACLGAGAATGPDTGWPSQNVCFTGGTCDDGDANTACTLSLRSGPVSVTGGSCLTGGGTLTKGPVTWATKGHACGDPDTTGGGCAASQKCLPIPPAPFLSAVCVYQLGVKACPAGQYDQQHVLYQGFLDMRACSACACGTPFGATCSATITAYGSDGCSSNVIGTFPAGGCLDTPGNPIIEGWSAAVVPPAGGLCTSSGGTFGGSVVPDPAQAVTFCCAAL